MAVSLRSRVLYKNNMNHNLNVSRFSALGARLRRPIFSLAALVMGLAAFASTAFGQSHQGGEANLILPDLSQVTFFGGVDGHRLLLVGILVCLLGLGFGMAMYMNLKKLPVHRAMREISELIYETCKTYLITQG